MQQSRHGQTHWCDGRIEVRAVIGDHLIAALHRTDRRFQHGAAGIAEPLARQQIRLLAHDAFAAHVDAELGLDPDDLTNPWQAAGASASAFTVGALLPMFAILLPPTGWRVPVTFVSVVLALVPLAFILFFVVSQGVQALNWEFFTANPVPVGELAAVFPTPSSAR